MLSKSKSSSAADLIKELESNAEFVQQRALKEQARIARASELSRSEAPLVAAFKRVGISVTSVWDLVNRRNDYLELIPTLIEHLERDYPDEILEGIARALATPDSICQRERLIEVLHGQFLSMPNVRYSICLAIAATTNASNLNETVALALSGDLGP